MLCESTRPRSILKAGTDLEDIIYVLKWLVEHKETIDFARYEAAHPERLFDAVRKLVYIGKRDGQARLLELLFSVLTEEDLAKIKDA
jgi:DNA-directed RNA polymerase subunit L